MNNLGRDMFLNGKTSFLQKISSLTDLTRNIFVKDSQEKSLREKGRYLHGFCIILSLLILLLLAAITYSGCSGSSKGVKTDDKIYVTVNGATLTESELKAIIPQDFYDRLTPDHKKKIVEDWVQKELLYQEAIKKNIDKDTEISRLILDTQKNLLSNELLERELATLKKPMEHELEAFYKQRKDYFETDTEEFRIRFAQFDTAEDADSFHSQVKKNQSFSDLAKTMSKDQESAQKGGDIGIVNEESVEPAVWNAVKATIKKFGLKKLSDPFIINDGWGCLIVDEVLPAGTLKPFASVRNLVEDMYMNEKRESAKKDLMQKLTKNAKIKYETF
jgi:peptidyl-prolyl cis-trans isomerase C